MARKKKAITKKDMLKIERAAKRAEQKAQGALDGRFRVRKVESGKKYTRKPRGAKDDEA